MKKYKYSCDGGSLLLGNENFTACYMNNYGDGTHHVYIRRRGEETPKDWTGANFYSRLNFEGCVTGKFNVYNYDCIHNEELSDKKNIIKTLSGRWAVYSVRENGDMLLEQWED